MVRGSIHLETGFIPLYSSPIFPVGYILPIADLFVMTLHLYPFGL